MSRVSAETRCDRLPLLVLVALLAGYLPTALPDRLAYAALLLAFLYFAE